MRGNVTDVNILRIRSSITDVPTVETKGTIRRKKIEHFQSGTDKVDIINTFTWTTSVSLTMEALVHADQEQVSPFKNSCQNTVELQTNLRIQRPVSSEFQQKIEEKQKHAQL